ncbi:hypothetical protein [Bacillus thuringiensis]|uniref:hypothetical protein n=1 Tax=Bacillus thuringiensis TaxID=1428 RepID=UPI0021D6819E|nr:hypothetical protein [Bacillus thuringiensis]MCU7666826.1 hypothetical protein [Bacillus thuringiensis]
MKNSKRLSKKLNKGKLVVFQYELVEQKIAYVIKHNEFRLLSNYVNSVIQILHHNVYSKKACKGQYIKNIERFFLDTPIEFRVTVVQKLMLNAHSMEKGAIKQLLASGALYEAVKNDVTRLKSFKK